MCEKDNILVKMIVLINHFRPKPTHIFLPKEDMDEFVHRAVSPNGFDDINCECVFNVHLGRYKFCKVIVCECNGPIHCAHIDEERIKRLLGEKEIKCPLKSR